MAKDRVVECAFNQLCEPQTDIRYTAGIRGDFNTMIDRFTKTDSLRYEVFNAIWRDMRMSLIYCGREDYRELQEFTEIVINMAKRLWLNSEKDIHLQVTGFYLLYSLYMKQPIKNVAPVKIRLTIEDWEKCRTFIIYLMENNHWDTYYIFCKLMLDKAFHFVFQKSAVFPGSDPDRAEELRTGTPYFENRLESYINDSTFQLLQHQHEAYEALKAQVLPQDLCLTDKNLVQSIKRLGSTDAPTEADNAPASTQVIRDSSSEVGQRRISLKEKQFANSIKLGKRWQPISSNVETR